MTPGPALGARVRAAGRAAFVAGVLVVVLAGCEPVAGPTSGSAAPTTASATGSGAPPATEAPATPDAAPEVTPAPAAAAATAPQGALAAALLLEVKGRAPKTGYARDQFGPSWTDTDRNGCDQRNDVLDRDLTQVVHQPSTHDCVVLTGNLADPYSGLNIAFERGQTTSGAVQIDHVVALSDSWQTGAQQWAAGTRQQFANDFLNLLAVDGPLNAQKSDGDAASWLPPNKAFRCEYVARQVGVKLTYGLWVTRAEQDAIVGVLAACPDQPLPVGVTAPVGVVVPAPAPAPVVVAPAPAPAPAPVDVYFKNCTAARAAGAAPVLLGQPGYGTHLDRDGDGVGCE